MRAWLALFGAADKVGAERICGARHDVQQLSRPVALSASLILAREFSAEQRLIRVEDHKMTRLT